MVRLLAGVSAAAIAAATFALPAAHADQVVSAVGGTMMGVSITPSGDVLQRGTMPVDVTREWRGPTLIVTITPR